MVEFVNEVIVGVATGITLMVTKPVLTFIKNEISDYFEKTIYL